MRAVSGVFLLCLPGGGRSYEGEGVRPDVVVADRPGAPGGEDWIVEAGIRALAAATRYPRSR